MTHLFDIEAEIQRQRRENIRDSESRMVIMGDGLGVDPAVNLYADGNRLWVRDIGGAGETVYNVPGLAYRVYAGSNTSVWIGKIVWIVWKPGIKAYQVDMSDPDQMQQIGMSMHLENPNDPHNQFHRTEQLLPLRAQWVGQGKISVQGYAYTYNGIGYQFPGTDEDTHIVAIDEAPAAGEQCYILLVYNYGEYVDDNFPIKFYLSTPKDSVTETLSTDDLNECIAQMDRTTEREIWAFRLSGDETEYYGHRDDRDRREWLNAPEVAAGAEVTITSPDGTIAITGSPGDTFTLDVADGAIDTDKLADNSVTNDKMADNSVGAAEIINGSVGTSELADDAITQDKIADNAIGTAQIQDDAVTQNELADNSVGNAQLQDNAVGTNEIADNAITNAKMADNSVNTAEIADNAVTNAKLADNAVNTAEIADNAITQAKMADNSVGTAELLDNNVTTAKINALAVTLAKMANGTAGKYIGYNSSGAAAELDIVIDISGTLGESVTVPMTTPLAMFLRESDGKWYKMSNDITASPIRMGAQRGFLVDASTGLANATIKIRRHGPLAGFTGLTANRDVWSASANGSCTTTAPSFNDGVYARLGHSLSTTSVFVDPDRPVLYRVLDTLVVQGDETILTHHADPDMARVIVSRELDYTDTDVVVFDETNQDSDIPVRGPSTGVTTIDNSGATASWIGNQGGTNRRNAQSFQVVGNQWLTQFNPRFGATTGAPTGQVNWSIQTDNAGVPSGTSLASGSFTPTASADNPITIAPLLLINGVPYWFVLQSANTQTSGNYWTILVQTPSGTYTGGRWKADASAGAFTGTWAVGGANDDMRATFTSTAASGLAMSYTVSGLGSNSVTRVRLWLKKVGAPTGDLTLAFYSNSGGVPNTLIGTSWAVSASSLSTSYGWIDFPFYADVTISQAASTTYHMVLQTTDSASASNYVAWGADMSSPGAPGAMSANVSSWANISPTADACFMVYVRVAEYVESCQPGSFARVTGDYAYRYGTPASSFSDASTITVFKHTRAIPMRAFYEVQVP